MQKWINGKRDYRQISVMEKRERRVVVAMGLIPMVGQQHHYRVVTEQTQVAED